MTDSHSVQHNFNPIFSLQRVTVEPYIPPTAVAYLTLRCSDSPIVIIIAAEEAGLQQPNSPDKCKTAWIDSQSPWM